MLSIFIHYSLTTSRSSEQLHLKHNGNYYEITPRCRILIANFIAVRFTINDTTHKVQSQHEMQRAGPPLKSQYLIYKTGVYEELRYSVC